MDLQLNRRVAIVTGAGTGIGLGITRRLAAEGVRVVMVGRRADVLEQAAESIAPTAAEPPLVQALDLSAPGAGRDLARRALAIANRVDIVVNSAGVMQPLSTGAPDEDWNAAIALRFAEVRHLVEALLPGMKERRFGRVINVGGSWEVQDVINAASVVNSARTAYSKSLSREVGRYGITVNTIGPGVIVSEQLDKRFPIVAERDNFIARNIPVGYFGEPDDVAVLAAFLASPLARYVNGEVVSVDGGLHRFAF